MAEHRVPKGNIIYIIPTDELFIKYKNNEAFIDEYGRLMNRKPHRVLKELKHYVADSEMQESYASSIKDLVRDKMVEYSKYAIDRVGDVFFYEVIPNVWHKHIVPLWNGAKDVLFSKELKIDQIKCETEYKVVENQSIFSETMTKEEVDAEKRKLLYHWIGLLSSLTKLRNAGELDVESTLAQLTEPMMILSQKMRILRILTTLMLLVLREVKSNLLSLSKRGEKVGIVVHCLELLYLEVQNQKYLFYRLQCVA